MNQHLYNEVRGGERMQKIRSDTEFGDDRGDICKDPLHNHPKEWHHGFSTPESGGFLTYFVSFKYPEKGYRNVYILNQVNLVKRAVASMLRFLGDKSLTPFYLLFLIIPWKFKMKIISRWLAEFKDMAGFFLSQYKHEYYLNERYYTSMTRELAKFIEAFLNELGVVSSSNWQSTMFRISKGFAFIIASLVEYDFAYYWRLQDLFDEVNVENLRKNPRKEILRIVGILKQREKHLHIIPKFESIANIATYIFLLPRVNKAFRKALESIDFKLMQRDEIDIEAVKYRQGYDYFGLTYEERLKKWPLEPHTYIELDFSKLSNDDLEQLMA